MIRSIREIVDCEVKKFNIENDEIKIILSNDNLSDITIYELSYDRRLKDKYVRDTSITMRFISKENDDILAISTILLYDRSHFERIKFWFHDKNQHSLKKISLKDVQEQIGNYAMTLGYSEISYKTTSKYAFTKFYINLIKEVMIRTDIFVFAEPTGVNRLSEDLTNLDTIHIDENVDINPMNFGKTQKISNPSNKLMRILEYNKLNNIYNLFTLGAVFSNKKIIF